MATKKNTTAKENNMEFTPEEIKLVNEHRAKLAASEAVKESQRRQEVVAASVAQLLEDVKTILQDAKRIAQDNNMEYRLTEMVKDMLNEVDSNLQWYGSDASLC